MGLREPGSTSFPLRDPPADPSIHRLTLFLPQSLSTGAGGCCARGHLLKTVESKSPLISVHLALPGLPCTPQWGRKASATADGFPAGSNEESNTQSNHSV